MTEHPYEYAILVEYLTPVALGGSPDFAEEPARQALRMALGKFADQLPRAISSLPAPIGGGWEVNSHSITFVGQTAVVSILLQRHKNQNI